MSNVDSILARSNELLMRVRRQIEESPSYLSELVHPPSRPVAVPFAPTAISLDETAHSIQTAGDIPPEADETSRPSRNDDETQRRLREFFASRMSALNSRISISQGSISELPPPPPPPEESPQSSDNEEPEEEKKTDILKPNLDEPFVIINKKTTILEPEEPLLSTADIPHPIQYDGNIDNVNFIEQDIAADGLWVPDLPLCKPENVRRIENRLQWIDQERQMFFGADLRLKVDTPPITQIAPPFPIEPLDHYGRGIVSFAPASVWGLEDIDIKREFLIEVQNVQFLVHPLSISEDILTKKIVQLFNAYEKNQSFSRIDYYKQKIAALREAWKKAAKDGDEDLEKKYLEDLHNCRELQEMEENNSLMIRDHLIKAYKELREIRNDLTISPLKLRWQRRNFTNDEKTEEQDKFNRELRHRIQEEMRRLQLDDKEPNESEIKREIQQRKEDLGLRKPGDCIWRPLLEYKGEVTPLDECPLQEKERREQISNAQVFLKYFVNRQETHKSNPSQIDANFVAAFSDNKKWVSNIIPHTIKIEIWESGYFKGSRYIASVILPITVGTLPEFKSYEFSSELTNADGQVVMGTLNARCYICPEDKGEVFISCPDGQTQKTKKRLAQDPSNFMSVPDLLKMAEKHDPNDPYMAAILSQTVAQRTSERIDRKNIRLDSLLEYSTFASLVPTSIGMQLQRDMERLRLQDEEQRRKLKEKKDKKDKKDESLDYLSRIRQKDIVKDTQLVRKVELKDLVNEAPIPTVPKIFNLIRKYMAMYRPLKPIREPTTSSKYTQSYMKAVIRIMNGYNIPQRTVTGTGPGTSASLIYSSIQNKSANVFCRITFNGKIKNTKCLNGSDPNWFESFEFPLSDNDDTRPDRSKLAQLQFRIDIFDKIVYDDVNDDRQRLTHTDHTENRIIGYINIELQALWAKDHIQGTYPVITPPFQLAYNKPDKPTGLVVFGAINPTLEDEETIPITDTAENEGVAKRAKAWMEKIEDLVKKTGNKRRILLMAAPRNGKPIIACRMVKKQNPPDMFEEREQLVRFVSMIPNYSDAQVFDADTSVWFTSGEFLKDNIGDDEEHALLLCNYFRHINLDAYVVLGHDYVNGKTTFVMTKEANKVTIYDPMTGLKWSSKDRDCLLYSVGMVFNEDNIWANIQNDVAPYSIRWNFHNPKEWYPFFNIDFPKPQFDSPQDDILNYYPIDQSKADLYESDLDQRIKDAIENWREHQQTSWNDDFGRKIHRALEACEMAAMSGSDSTAHIIDDFRMNFMNYRMNGGPFCMTFTSYEDILHEVEIRETWKTEASNVAFALGVFVVPYPNSLFAVWVMVATLERLTIADSPL